MRTEPVGLPVIETQFTVFQFHLADSHSKLIFLEREFKMVCFRPYDIEQKITYQMKCLRACRRLDWP